MLYGIICNFYITLAKINITQNLTVNFLKFSEYSMTDETIIMHAWFPSHHATKENGMIYQSMENIRYGLQCVGIPLKEKENKSLI